MLEHRINPEKFFDSPSKKTISSYTKNSSVENDFKSINNEISRLKFEESEFETMKERSGENPSGLHVWENQEIWSENKKDDSSCFKKKIADFTTNKIKNLKKAIKIETNVPSVETKCKTTTPKYKAVDLTDKNLYNPDYTNDVDESVKEQGVHSIQSLPTNYNNLSSINETTAQKLKLKMRTKQVGALSSDNSNPKDYSINTEEKHSYRQNLETTILSTNESINESFERPYINYTAGNNRYEKNYLNFNSKKIDFNNLQSSGNPFQNYKPSSFCYPSNDQQINQANLYVFNSQDPGKSNGNRNNNNDQKPKAKKRGDEENSFTIIEENIISGKDKRTNVMIKNIPNKYSIGALLEEINFYYKGKFDFLYLPVDSSNNNCNLGFAFINFIDPLHILMFLQIFLKKRWKKYNSMKQCELAYAKFQGKKELTAHFERNLSLNTQSDEMNPYIANNQRYPAVIEVPIRYLSVCKKYMSNLDLEVMSDRFILRSFTR